MSYKSIPAVTKEADEHVVQNPNQEICIPAEEDNARGPTLLHEILLSHLDHSALLTDICTTCRRDVTACDVTVRTLGTNQNSPNIPPQSAACFFSLIHFSKEKARQRIFFSPLSFPEPSHPPSPKHVPPMFSTPAGPEKQQDDSSTHTESNTNHPSPKLPTDHSIGLIFGLSRRTNYFFRPIYLPHTANEIMLGGLFLSAAEEAA